MPPPGICLVPVAEDAPALWDTWVGQGGEGIVGAQSPRDGQPDIRAEAAFFAETISCQGDFQPLAAEQGGIARRRNSGAVPPGGASGEPRPLESEPRFAPEGVVLAPRGRGAP